MFTLCFKIALTRTVICMRGTRFEIDVESAMSMLNSLAVAVFEQYGYSTYFRRDMRCGRGGTSHGVNDEHVMNIGVSGLYDIDATLSKRIATARFVDTVAALFHEVGHRFQYDIIERDSVSACPNIADSMMAAEASSLYAKRNNAVLAHEVSAEGIAMMMLYDYLTAIGGESLAQTQVESHMRRCARSTIYQMDLSCIERFNRDGIECGFERYYARCLSAERSLPIALTRFEHDSKFGPLEDRICNEPDTRLAFDLSNGMGRDVLVATCGIEFDSELRDVFSGFVPYFERGAGLLQSREPERTAIDETKYLASVFDMSQLSFEN